MPIIAELGLSFIEAQEMHAPLFPPSSCSGNDQHQQQSGGCAPVMLHCTQAKLLEIAPTFGKDMRLHLHITVAASPHQESWGSESQHLQQHHLQVWQLPAQHAQPVLNCIPGAQACNKKDECFCRWMDSASKS